MIGTCPFDIFVTVFMAHAGLHCLVDDGVHVSKEVERSSQILPKFSRLGDGVGEYRPYIGNRETSTDCGQAIRREEVGWICRLSVCF